jgi:signal peptidase I
MTELDPQTEETPEVPLEQQQERKIVRRTLEAVGIFFLEIIKIVVLSAITIGLVRYFLFKPFYVKGQSMESTFFQHEYLIIDELSYRFREPVRGEVIVFHAPTEPGDYYLKRIIGLPGEQVKVDENKVVIYNTDHPQGVLLEEPYLDSDIETKGSVFVTLGDDEYFVMGDNREASLDSRRFGPIKQSSIVGRTWVRGYPFARMGVIKPPTYQF